jgi:hypothetical protein
MGAVTDMRGLLTIMRAAGKAGNERGARALPASRGYPSHKHGALSLH